MTTAITTGLLIRVLPVNPQLYNINTKKLASKEQNGHEKEKGKDPPPITHPHPGVQYRFQHTAAH